MEKKYKVYCDMDGVLTDFNKGYEELTGRNIEGQFIHDKEFFEPINKAGKDFWGNLSWTKDGKELWGYLKKYNPELLSSPTIHNTSRVGKNEWVDKELPGTHLILRSSENKKEFASPISILIDDRDVNIEQWIEKGGIGILHTSTKNTIKELKKLGL